MGFHLFSEWVRNRIRSGWVAGRMNSEFLGLAAWRLRKIPIRQRAVPANRYSVATLRAQWAVL